MLHALFQIAHLLLDILWWVIIAQVVLSWLFVFNVLNTSSAGVRTFAQQIEHAAGSDAFIAHLAITGSAKGIPAMGDTAVYLHDKAALKKYAAAAMDHTIAMLRGVSDAAMDEQIVQFGNKVTRGRALMELLDHFPWTLGQTVPYLRLNGVTPPEYSPF